MKGILTFCLVLGLCAPVWAQKLTAFLDEKERRAAAETFQHALENNKDGAESSWANPECHHSGAVTPTRSYINEDNLSCREYITTIMIEGASTRTVGSACRNGDGGWVVMGERTEVSSSNPQHVYVYRDPYVYGSSVYTCYAPAFYPHRLFFSFAFGTGAFFYPYFYDGWWYGGPYYHHHHHHHSPPPPGPAPHGSHGGPPGHAPGHGPHATGAPPHGGFSHMGAPHGGFHRAAPPGGHFHGGHSGHRPRR